MKEKEFNLSEKRKMLREFVLEKSHNTGGNKKHLNLSPYYIYPERDVKEKVQNAQRRIKELDKGLQNQLINDFRTSLIIKSIKRIIITRFKMTNEEQSKIFLEEFGEKILGVEE